MNHSVWTWLETTGTRGIRVLVIAAIAFTLTRVLKALTARLIQISKGSTRVGQLREQQTRTVAGLLYSIGSALIVAVAILTALPEFGFNVTPVAAAAAVASLAFGFGAQTLVKDLINGFFIVFEDQYVVGDLLQVNGETGRVEHLTLRRTVLRNVKGAIVTIPNSLIGQVSNLSRDWSQVFVDITVPTEDVTLPALSLLEKVTAEFRNDSSWSGTLLDGPRVLGIESLSMDGTVLRIQARTALLRQDDVARELRRRILMAFENERIPISSMHKVHLQGDLTPSVPQSV